MIKQSSDTSLDAENTQIELIRKSSPARRFQITRSLSETVLSLSWKAIQKANPEKCERDIDLLFVKHHYGPELADSLAIYLEKRAS